MKLGIVGSRTFNDYEKLKSRVALFDDVELIVSGGADGADSLGEKYADENQILLEKYPAEWKKFGKSAGYIRNLTMAEVGDALIAFWDGQSKGTKHMINIAYKHNLKIYIEKYGNKK